MLSTEEAEMKEDQFLPLYNSQMKDPLGSSHNDYKHSEYLYNHSHRPGMTLTWLILRGESGECSTRVFTTAGVAHAEVHERHIAAVAVRKVGDVGKLC
jgi:hypothetical protein